MNPAAFAARYMTRLRGMENISIPRLFGEATGMLFKNALVFTEEKGFVRGGFTVAEGHFDQATSTSVIDKIDKVFDVSAVSIPANPGTEIESRSAYDGEIIRARAERRDKIRRLKARIKISEMAGGIQPWKN